MTINIWVYAPEAQRAPEGTWFCDSEASLNLMMPAPTVHDMPKNVPASEPVSVYMYIYAYTYVNAHVYMCVRKNAYLHRHTHGHTRRERCISKYFHFYVYTYIRLHTVTHMHMHKRALWGGFGVDIKMSPPTWNGRPAFPPRTWLTLDCPGVDAGQLTAVDGK